MSKTLPLILLIGITTVLLTISFSEPQLLDDRNTFLKAFVGPDFLATLGFILTVTLASSASLHLELNKLEDATGTQFGRTRSSIRRSVFSLMALFVAGIVLLSVKPLLPSPPYNQAVANSFAILILFFNLSVLYDLTRTVFAIPSVAKIKELGNDDPSRSP